MTTKVILVALATLLVALAIALASLVASVGAEEPAEQPAKAEQLRQQFLEERANALANILVKRAELMRLVVHKDPDEKEVQRLSREIVELQNALRQKCAEYRTAVGAFEQVAPGAVPGLGAGKWAPGPGAGRWGRVAPDYSPTLGPSALRRGYASGRAAPWAGGTGGPGPGLGVGPGRGAAWDAPGREQGVGPNVRFSLGPRVPRGGGRGPGAYGPGFGRAGRGRTGGPGTRAWGPGPYFIDRDNNGVCDYWEGPENPPGPPPEEPAEAPAE